MSSYAIQVRNKETGEFDTVVEGDAKSRRKFLQTQGQSKRVQNESGYRYRRAAEGKVKELVDGRKQWRCVAV